MKNLKFGNVILCDYVGSGQANKFNLVNVISGDVIVAAMPAEVRFGLFMETIVQEGQRSDFTIEVIAAGETVFRAEGDGNPVTPGQGAVLAIPFFAVKLEEDTTIEVFLSAAGFKRTRALKKKISRGVIPSSV